MFDSKIEEIISSETSKQSRKMTQSFLFWVKINSYTKNYRNKILNNIKSCAIWGTIICKICVCKFINMNLFWYFSKKIPKMDKQVIHF